MHNTSRNLTTSALTAVGLFFALVTFGAAPEEAPAQQRPDATPERVDGMIAPIIATPAAWKTEAERLALVQATMKHRAELIGRFPPPTLFTQRVPDGAIKVNGKLDESEWKQADVATNFMLTRELTPAMEQTRVRIVWDSKYLYFGFDCADTNLLATLKEPDGEFWREDAVEVFLNPSRDEMSYVEYETTPRGLPYDAACADYRPEIDWAKDLRHLDLVKIVTCYNARDMHVGVQLNGALDKPAGSSKGWTCEMAISWSDIARGANVTRCPPKDGDSWRMELARVNAGTNTDVTEYSAWNPTTSWFHVPWVWGLLVFVE